MTSVAFKLPNGNLASDFTSHDTCGAISILLVFQTRIFRSKTGFHSPAVFRFVPFQCWVVIFEANGATFFVLILYFQLFPVCIL